MPILPGSEWNSIEAEENIIACSLSASNKEILPYLVSYLEPDDFYSRKHGDIFRTVCNFFTDGRDIDLISISSAGYDMGELASIINNVPILSYKNSSQLVKTLSMKRRAAITAKNILSELGKQSFEKPEEIAEYINNKLDLNIPKTQQTPEDLNSIVDETWKHIEALAKGKIKPVPFGMRDIDAIIGGLWQSELTLVAAGPATGKTAFALDVSTNAASNGYNVEIFSREMNRIQIATRMLCQTRLIKADELKKPGVIFGDEKLSKNLSDASIRISGLPISIDQSSSTIQQIVNKCQRKKESGKLDLVVIDYLQLLTSSKRHENRRLEVEHISRELKLLSRDLNIPVMALSQLSRDGQSSGRPNLSALRESGALEQDADNVIFLYNPKPDETISAAIVDLSIIIGKQRNGRTGEVNMRFDREHMKFFGLER